MVAIERQRQSYRPANHIAKHAQVRARRTHASQLSARDQRCSYRRHVSLLTKAAKEATAVDEPRTTKCHKCAALCRTAQRSNGVDADSRCIVELKNGRATREPLITELTVQSQLHTHAARAVGCELRRAADGMRVIQNARRDERVLKWRGCLPEDARGRQRDKPGPTHDDTRAPTHRPATRCDCRNGNTPRVKHTKCESGMGVRCAIGSHRKGFVTRTRHQRRDASDILSTLVHMRLHCTIPSKAHTSVAKVAQPRAMQRNRSAPCGWRPKW